MMIKSSVWFCCPLVVIVLATLTSCSAKEKEDEPKHVVHIRKSLPPEKLQKSLSKINKYLEKNVKSDDVDANMAKVDELIHDKLAQYSLFGGETLVNAAKLLKEISELPDYEDKCDKDFRRSSIMEIIDPGLAKESRENNPNYKLKRVDRLIQYLAFEDARRCKYERLPGEVHYAYRQKTYEAIKKLLNEALPHTQDAEVSLETAEELLEKMEPKDGAMAEGLRLLLSLRETLNVDTCNGRGFEILFKNDLATKRLGRLKYRGSWDRMSRIYYHYAMRHEELCRPVMPQTFISELHKLDRNTYELVLGLVTSAYVDTYKYGDFVKELRAKKRDDHFYTSQLVDYVATELAYSKAESYELDRIKTISGYRLGHLIKAEGAARNDVNIRYVETPVLDKLKKLAKVYIFEPCQRFLEIFGPLVEADEFGTFMYSEHTSNKKSEFLPNLTYHTVRAAVRACQYAYYNQDKLVENMAMAFSHSFYSNIKTLGPSKIF